MPQLNPVPWLSIFLTTWLIIIIMTPIKTNHQYLNAPNLKTYACSTNPWLWPWI